MGWDLNVAEARDEYLTESDCWRYTQQFLMHAHHTTTYKFILMKALLESVTEISDSGRLTFAQVTKHVTKIYWNLTVTHKLSQLNSRDNNSSNSEMEKLWHTFGKSNWFVENLSWNEVCCSVQELAKAICT